VNTKTSSEGARVCLEWGAQRPAGSAGTMRVGDASARERRVGRTRTASGQRGDHESWGCERP